MLNSVWVGQRFGRYMAMLLAFAPVVLGVERTAAGDIRGRVRVEGRPSAPASIVSRRIIQRYAERRPSHSTGVGRQVGNTPAVVYLVGITQETNDFPGGVAVMDQRGEQFVPHVLAIHAGTIVRFLNSDDVYHNVFSLSPAKSFDLGRYPKGEHRDVLFDEPGVVSVYCDIHTHMNAFIVVVPNSYFATTDTTGRFQIEDVPAGTYEVRAWYGRWPEKSQVIRVSRTGSVEVDFVFP